MYIIVDFVRLIIKYIKYISLMERVYIDGIFDLFHRGHIESLKQAKNIRKNVYLVVGVISDRDANNYKRMPIINEDDRAELLRNVNIVDEVITNAPLVVTKEFVELNNIDLVVHGFSDNEDWDKQKDFFEYLINENKFEKIDYYNKTSTTDIINRIKTEY